MNRIIHPPIEGLLRSTTSENDLNIIGGAIACRHNALINRRAVGTGMAQQAMTRHIHTVTLRSGRQLRID